MITIFCYLGTVAATQTVYGGPFMEARWLALALLLIIACFSWTSAQVSRGNGLHGSGMPLVIAYLCLTFLTVIMAENPLFSGLKWASHAAMVVVFLVFLLQSLSLRQVGQTLNMLKWLVAALVILSCLKPVATVQYQDVELFRGSFGSPNSLGQVAAIGGLLFLHSLLTAQPGWLRRAEAVTACAAAWLVWSSGARSAMVASITGIFLMSSFYPARLSRKLLWIILVIGGLALAVPDMPKAVTQFVLREKTDTRPFSELIFVTRAPVWEAAWEGFKRRPLFGWGFGADDHISRHWEIQLTALGTTTRDQVNDVLVVLESTGIVGLMGYLLLIILALKQVPTRHQRFLIRKMHGPPMPKRNNDFSAYHVHAIAFIISVSLLITVQFDNTALSAGNFVSVVLWLCVALAGAIKKKALAYEAALVRRRDLSIRLRNEAYRSGNILARH